MNGRRPLLPYGIALSLFSCWFGYEHETSHDPPRDVIELELFEYVHGEAMPVRTREMSVALSGDVHAESDLLDEPGACRLRARPLRGEDRDDPLLIELDCHTHAGGASSLQVRAERAFARDEPSLIGVVDMHGARRLEVHATRH